MAEPQPQQAPPPLDSRTLAEQQAVFNMAELASTQAPSKLDGLTEALLVGYQPDVEASKLTSVQANADPAVLSIMARGSAENFANGDLNTLDKQSLRAMLVHMEAMTDRIKGMLGNGSQNGDNSALDLSADGGLPDAEIADSDGTESIEGGVASIKNESVEPPADLPTPATTTQDNPEPVGGLGEKSSQEVPNETSDDVAIMDLD